jgi:hypothetical protein
MLEADKYIAVAWASPGRASQLDKYQKNGG